MPKLAFPNFLRGGAAVAVMLTHYLGDFWTRREQVSSQINAPVLPATYAHPALPHGFQPFFDGHAAHFAVAVFFLISGFLVPFSTARLNWKGFVIARSFRVVPTYVAGFAVTLAAVWLCGLYFGRPFPFDLARIVGSSLPGLSDLTHTPNISPIAWTLNVEIKFYILCAVSIAVLRRHSFAVAIIPALLALLGAGAVYWRDAVDPHSYPAELAVFNAPLLIYMFIGVAFHYHYEGALSTRQLIGISAALFVLYAAISVTGEMFENRVAYEMAAIYLCAVIVFALMYFFRDSLPQENRATAFFSDISYPLYIVHQVLGWSFLRVILPLGFGVFATVAFVAACMCGLAWIMHIFIEAPTHEAGKMLARRYGSANSAS